jgi:hypothetical protein
MRRHLANYSSITWGSDQSKYSIRRERIRCSDFQGFSTLGMIQAKYFISRQKVITSIINRR